MDKDSTSNINGISKFPIKAVIDIGELTIVPLDKSIVNTLEISESTLLEQRITEDGVLLRIVKIEEK